MTNSEMNLTNQTFTRLTMLTKKATFCIATSILLTMLFLGCVITVSLLP